LTEAGRTLITTVFEAHSRELESWMSVLTGTEKQQAYGVLKKLGLQAAAVHEAGTRLPEGEMHDRHSKK
jgi:hypothetical protein